MIQHGNKMLEVEENLLKWAKSQIPDLEDMTPLREQASSRQYFRASSTRESFILVFSDPQRELNNEFIKYSEFLIKTQSLIYRMGARKVGRPRQTRVETSSYIQFQGCA